MTQSGVGIVSRPFVNGSLYNMLGVVCIVIEDISNLEVEALLDMVTGMKLLKFEDISRGLMGYVVNEDIIKYI